MAKIGLWKIEQNGPQRLGESPIDLEKQLEDWIEQDPSLVQNGLRMIGRQVPVREGRLDLLALDPNGRLVVIEIKPGYLFSDTIGQVMFYAAAIAKMSYEDLEMKINSYLNPKGSSFKSLLDEIGVDEQRYKSSSEREVLMMLVGASVSEGLQNTLDYFSSKFPISSISFEVFEAAGGAKILTRNLSDLDFPSAEKHDKKKSQYSIEGVCLIANRAGIGNAFRKLLEAAQKNGLYARPYARSIMYTPPQRHYRMLFTVWVNEKSKNKVKVYMGSDVFAEFYPISEEKAKSIFGPIGWREMTEKDVIELINSLNKFFEEIKQQKV